MPRHRWDPVAEPPRWWVRPVRAGAPDGPTRSQVADRRWWRSSSRGWHVPTYVDDGRPEQRILEQSMRLPAGGAVTGWAAARLHGAAFFDGLDRDGTTRLPVPLALGRGGRIRGDGRVVLTYHDLPSAEVVVRHGIRVVTPERAVVDHLRLADDPREVVVALDMVAAAAVVALEDVALHAQTLGSGERAALELAVARSSEHSRSPNETRLRLIAELDAGLPRLLVNCPVHDRSGRLLGIADLLDVEAGFAIESDGAEHRTTTRHTRDVAKDEAFRRAGLELTRITGPDLMDVPRVVDRLQGGALAGKVRRCRPAPVVRPSPGQHAARAPGRAATGAAAARTTGCGDDSPTTLSTLRSAAAQRRVAGRT